MPDLRRELGPGILPRHLRVLERLSGRLEAERPVPSPAFRRALAEPVEGREGAEGGAVVPGGRLGAWICLVSGLGLLLGVALLAL